MDYDKGTQWNYGSTEEQVFIYNLKMAYDQKNILPILRAYVNQEKPLRILEFGPGCGTLAAILYQNYPQVDYTALDCDPVVLERIKARFPNAETIIAENHKTFEEKTLSKKYDVIVGIDVWEHLDKKELLQYTTTSYHLLLDHGIFIAQVPNISCPLAINTIFAGDITHQNMFNEISAKQLLIISGFSLNAIEIRAFEFPAINIFWRIRSILRSCYFFYVKFLMLLLGVSRVNILTPNLIMVGKKGNGRLSSAI